MAIQEVPPVSQAQGPSFQVIEGGRLQLEQAALDAVFSDTSALPELLKQLAPKPAQLSLVATTEAVA